MHLQLRRYSCPGVDTATKQGIHDALARLGGICGVGDTYFVPVPGENLRAHATDVRTQLPGPRATEITKLVRPLAVDAPQEIRLFCALELRAGIAVAGDEVCFGFCGSHGEQISVEQRLSCGRIGGVRRFPEATAPPGEAARR